MWLLLTCPHADSVDLTLMSRAQSSAELWTRLSRQIREQPWTSGDDFVAWLNLLSRREHKKVVLVLDEGDALSGLSDELRSEFLETLRWLKNSQETSAV